MLGVGSVWRIDADNEDRAGLVRAVRGAAMYSQCRPGGNVASLRQLGRGPFNITIPQLLGREHVVLAAANIVPLRAERDFERAMFGPRVDRGQVERKRVQPPPYKRRLR